MSSSNFWIMIGMVATAIAAVSIPYGFHLKSQEKKLKGLTKDKIIISFPEHKSTVESKKPLEEKIKLLHVEAQIEYFFNILEKPRFKNRIGKYIEYIFVDDLAYIQVITDVNGKVHMVSVTTRSKDFTPEISLPTGDKIVLGKTFFSKISTFPQKISGLFGARLRHLCYYEMHLFNPGNYQYCILSVNPAGYSHHFGDISILSKGGTLFPTKENQRMDNQLGVFRSQTSINTYSITSPSFDGVDTVSNEVYYGPDKINFGPWINQISLINHWKFPGSE